MPVIALDRWLQHLVKHLPVAKEGRDPEGVHQVRVAVRRLRVWLRLAGMRVLEDDLAWLVRAAGEVRDLEVLLQHPDLPKAFRNWAASRLEQARAALVPLLDSPRLAGLLQALANLPPLDEEAAKARLKRFVRQAARKAEEWRNQDSIESLHALRRALRRLRYAREWLGLDSQDEKALQEIFGQVGDLSFTLRYLAAFEAEGSRVPAAYKRQLEAQLTEALEAARAAWHTHQADLG
ncbi:MAG: CHAD domain-containing protein [Meiothermus sp.]|uniref:CHAD domain-containing protein n=1 Tax=Meiothermus sp. TaxID=1955249 RepID=UPI0028CEE2DA|nr:CHAD domain-containing protein [Meiothermus sp.]MDT7919429.1 CHAD domain-containing protein [Meiothermus sp.]